MTNTVLSSIRTGGEYYQETSCDLESTAMRTWTGYAVPVCISLGIIFQVCITSGYVKSNVLDGLYIYYHHDFVT